MSFFTMRPSASRLTGYMPGARDQLRGRPGRNHLLPLGPWLDPAAQGRKVGEDTLIPTDVDGLAAFLYRAGAGIEFVTAPAPDRCGGQYLVVLGGLVDYRGGTYGARSLGWTAPGGAGAALTAGPDGASVLVCQFPVSTAGDSSASPDAVEAEAPSR